MAKNNFICFISNMEVNFNRVQNLHNIVRKNFPYESPWVQQHIQYSSILNKRRDPSLMSEVIRISRLLAQTRELIDKIRDRYMVLINSPLEYFKELIKSVHEYKIQNCGESARITYAAARINKVSNSDVDLAVLNGVEAPKDYSRSLFPGVDKFMDSMRECEFGKNYNILDHIVAQIHNEKGNDFILDPLLDECGTTKKLEGVYKTKYGEALNLPSEETIEFVTPDYVNTQYPKLQDDEARRLANMFPSLVLPENTTQLSPKKWFHFLNM